MIALNEDQKITSSLNLYIKLRKDSEEFMYKASQNIKVPSEEVIDLVNRIKHDFNRIYVKEHQKRLKRFIRFSHFYLRDKCHIQPEIVEIMSPRPLYEDIEIIEGKRAEKIYEEGWELTFSDFRQYFIYENC